MRRHAVKIVVEQMIRMPPEAVFPWVAEPEKAMRWQKDVREGKILVDKPEIIGTTFTEIVEENGNRLEMKGTIINYEKDRVIGFHLESRVHDFIVHYRLEAAGRNTRFRVEAEIRWKFPMNVMSLFLGGKMKAGLVGQLNSEILELKKICETD
jgi:hypothetical protein